MNVVVIFNPIAGAGRAAGEADTLAETLIRAGHDVQLVRTQPQKPENWIDDALSDAELAVVVGGDGTVRLSVESAVRCRVPIYQFPLGTENLFAREFAMDRNPDRLIQAIQQFTVRSVDVGFANGFPFVIMASIGYDAAVVHDLHARRGSSISHATYLAPMIRQFLTWKPPRFQVKVDGRDLAGTHQGQIVVANCRQYGWGFDPAWEATMDDGLLDVVILPMRCSLSLPGYLLSGYRRRLMSNNRVFYTRGRNVQIHLETPHVYQIDGDCPPAADKDGEGSKGQDQGTVSDLHIYMQAKTLQVLIPPQAPTLDPRLR